MYVFLIVKASLQKKSKFFMEKYFPLHPINEKQMKIMFN